MATIRPVVSASSSIIDRFDTSVFVLGSANGQRLSHYSRGKHLTPGCTEWRAGVQASQDYRRRCRQYNGQRITVQEHRPDLVHVVPTNALAVALTPPRGLFGRHPSLE
jgi:hypothetical protein